MTDQELKEMEEEARQIEHEINEESNDTGKTTANNIDMHKRVWLLKKWQAAISVRSGHGDND